MTPSASMSWIARQNGSVVIACRTYNKADRCPTRGVPGAARPTKDLTDG
jgi:hypothetical protein